MSEASKSPNSPPPLAGGGRGEPGASLSHARALRRDATPAERKLWQGLRKHQVKGLKFRRQVPLGPYTADFYCASARLVIEVDGISHIDSRSDATRDTWMAQHGIRVIRVANRDVLANLEGTVIAIGEIAATPPPPDLLPQGEGEVCAPSSYPTAIHLHV